MWPVLTLLLPLLAMIALRPLLTKLYPAGEPLVLSLRELNPLRFTVRDFGAAPPPPPDLEDDEDEEAVSAPSDDEATTAATATTGDEETHEAHAEAGL